MPHWRKALNSSLACNQISDYVGENPAAVDSKLQRVYFDALHFSHLIGLFDSDCIRRQDQVDALRRNIVSAPFLKQRFAAAHSTTLFSATLSPRHFYSDTLGLPTNTAWIDVQSPFSVEQLPVRIISHISTRYQDRDHSLAPIVDVMAKQTKSKSAITWRFSAASTTCKKWPPCSNRATRRLPWSRHAIWMNPSANNSWRAFRCAVKA